MRRPRFGLTILELVIAVIAIVVIVGIFVITYPRGGGRRIANQLKDATQIQQIHHSMLVFAREFDGRYPLPGLINRLANPETGLHIPGRGEEDVSLNHTAPFYSVMIAQNYMSPALLISPLEVNEFVTDKEVNYNYNSYDPAADSYWDANFSAHIDKNDPGSNVSYAHMALCGERKEKYWRDSMVTDVPLLGTRGPENGATTGEKYTKSLTLQFIEPDDQWAGNICFADGNVQRLDSLEPESLQRPNSLHKYNLFRMDGGALGISIASTADDVTRVWDPLVDE